MTPELREQARLALMDWLNRKYEPRDFEDRGLSDFEIGYLKATEDRSNEMGKFLLGLSKAMSDAFNMKDKL